MAFTQSKVDYSLFTRGHDGTFVALLVYVDDIILTGPSPTVLNFVKTILKSHFQLKDLGSVKYFLGLEISRSSRGISLSQRKYCLQILEDTSFLGARPAVFPMDSNLRLSKYDGEPLSDKDAIAYRRLLDRLLYLQISRPDISFPMDKLS